MKDEERRAGGGMANAVRAWQTGCLGRVVPTLIIASGTICRAYLYTVMEKTLAYGGLVSWRWCQLPYVGVYAGYIKRVWLLMRDNDRGRNLSSLVGNISLRIIIGS